jgi:Glycosyl hydrolases family 32 N-terminal domain
MTPIRTIRFVGRLFNGDQVVQSDTQVRPSFPLHQIGWAYGPSIIKWNNVYHIFFCSACYDSTPSVAGMDLMRYATSTDGLNWSDPGIILYPTGENQQERSCCDPSVVFFSGFWYMFYSGNVVPYQTVMFVARSAQIDGPYLKYTKRGTWEKDPADPMIILTPINPVPPPFWYGAGQQTVVVAGNRLFSWYSDDTLDYPHQNVTRLRFTTSVDGVSWSTPVTCRDSNGSDLLGSSVDVKFDSNSGEFVLFEASTIEQSNTPPRRCILRRRYSADGIQWSSPEVLCDDFAFPHFAGNVGVSGDEKGTLLTEGTLIAYGADHVSNVDDVFGVQLETTAHYDMYAHYLGGFFTGPVGYFADTGSTWYSDGQTYCAFLSAGHFQMHSDAIGAPSIGAHTRSEFGTCIGACPTPAGYFAYGTATHFSQGNGTYVSFASPADLTTHHAMNPSAPNFGTLQSDPNGFMKWAGIWHA